MGRLHASSCKGAQGQETQGKAAAKEGNLGDARVTEKQFAKRFYAIGMAWIIAWVIGLAVGLGEVTPWLAVAALSITIGGGWILAGTVYARLHHMIFSEVKEERAAKEMALEKQGRMSFKLSQAEHERDQYKDEVERLSAKLLEVIEEKEFLKKLWDLGNGPRETL